MRRGWLSDPQVAVLRELICLGLARTPARLACAAVRGEPAQGERARRRLRVLVLLAGKRRKLLERIRSGDDPQNQLRAEVARGLRKHAPSWFARVRRLTREGGFVDDEGRPIEASDRKDDGRNVGGSIHGLADDYGADRPFVRWLCDRFEDRDLPGDWPGRFDARISWLGGVLLEHVRRRNGGRLPRGQPNVCVFEEGGGWVHKRVFRGYPGQLEESPHMAVARVVNDLMPLPRFFVAPKKPPPEDQPISYPADRLRKRVERLPPKKIAALLDSLEKAFHAAEIAAQARRLRPPTPPR